MTEQNSMNINSEQTERTEYSNPTAQKIMNWMELLLQLCKLLKSILSKVFLWIEKWETNIQHRTTPPVI